jgi:hypothetical protein
VHLLPPVVTITASKSGTMWMNRLPQPSATISESDRVPSEAVTRQSTSLKSHLAPVASAIWRENGL